jgi:hypothetical protein
VACRSGFPPPHCRRRERPRPCPRPGFQGSPPPPPLPPKVYPHPHPRLLLKLARRPWPRRNQSCASMPAPRCWLAARSLPQLGRCLTHWKLGEARGGNRTAPEAKMCQPVRVRKKRMSRTLWRELKKRWGVVGVGAGGLICMAPSNVSCSEEKKAEVLARATCARWPPARGEGKELFLGANYVHFCR